MLAVGRCRWARLPCLLVCAGRTVGTDTFVSILYCCPPTTYTDQPHSDGVRRHQPLRCRDQKCQPSFNLYFSRPLKRQHVYRPSRPAVCPVSSDHNHVHVPTIPPSSCFSTRCTTSHDGLSLHHRS